MIETIEYKNFQGFTGDSHKVGVSKPLSELTPDDIINYDKYLCGEINKYVNVTYFGQIPQISLPESADNKPMFSTNVSWNDTFWCNQPPKKDLYMRTLLLNVPNNKRDREYTFTILDKNVRIVTELTDFQDMYITTKIGKPDGAPYSTKTEAGTVETGKISGIVKNILTDTSYIIPVWVITDGTNLWITSGVIYHSYYVNFNNNLTNQGFISGIADFNNNKDNSLSFGINPNLTSEPVKCTDILPESEKPYTVNVNEKTFGIMITYGASNYQPRGKFWFNNNIDENATPFGENNQFIDITAYYGMYMRSNIKNNGEYVWYKPIITGGMVTGYTTDMNAKSDIDDWEILDNHNIPIIPPSPGGDDDDNSDDINFGYAFSGAGAFTNLWYCTQKDLADLRQWFLGADAEHPIPEGFDPMPSIIGLFQYPISLGGDVLEEIKFRTSSGLIVSTGVQAARGLSTNLKFDLGFINIPARMKERGVPFLDYESTVECYVPFCGVFQLDTQTVIGKTLSCTLWMSPATGECNCIVYTISNGIKAPVAYGSGNMSSQIPISSNGWGSYAAALKNATIQKNQIVAGAATGGISSVLSGIGNTASILDLGEQITGVSVGSAFGAAGLALSGAGTALGLLSTGIKAYQDINAANVGIRHLKASNGTSINGAFSGQSAWNYPMTPYVKISRPHYKKPSNYAHTQGIPLVEAKKLSECSGFTMCVGADLTGITATQTERDIISAYLTNGIIV